MQIALCHPYVLAERGGCERYLTDLTRYLSDNGHEVQIYAARWANLPAAVRCQRVPVPGACGRAQRPWLFSAACRAALARSRHDVSVGFDKTYGQDVLYPQGGLYRATAEHNLLVPPTRVGRWNARCRQRLDPAYWSFLRLERRQYLSQARPAIVVNSRLVAAHFERFYGIPATRLHLLPSAIDSARLHAPTSAERRNQVRQAWGVAPQVSVGLFAAMNYALKGLEPLLRALRHLPATLPFRLLVAGNPHNGPYRALAHRLGVADRVQFLGQRADMADCYGGADFLIHPTFYDPCSLVVLEALACGLPVITSRHNGASELLRPPTDGLVVADPHDHCALAASIQQLCVPEVRARCAAAALQAAARWTWQDHCRQLLRILEGAAASRRSRLAA